MFPSSCSSVVPNKQTSGFIAYPFSSTGHLFVVTMLREPASRVISEYLYIMRKRKGHEVAQAQMSMKQFYSVYHLDKGLDNIMTRQLAGAVKGVSFLDPQVQAALISNKSALLETAKRNLEQCFFVGIQEWMSESLDLLEFSFGFKPARRVPMLPHTTLADWSSQTINEIRSINHLDVQLYDHAKTLFKKRLTRMTMKTLKMHI